MQTPRPHPESRQSGVQSVMQRANHTENSALSQADCPPGQRTSRRLLSAREARKRPRLHLDDREAPASVICATRRRAPGIRAAAPLPRPALNPFITRAEGRTRASQPVVLQGLGRSFSVTPQRVLGSHSWKSMQASSAKPLSYWESWACYTPVTTAWSVTKFSYGSRKEPIQRVARFAPVGFRQQIRSRVRVDPPGRPDQERLTQSCKRHRPGKSKSGPR